MERQLCTQMSVWQQGNHDNVCHVVWIFWLTLSRFLHFFLVLLLLILNNICLLSVLPYDISLWKTKMGYICGSSCKTLISNSANDKGVLQRYLSISCFDNIIFNFYYLILGKLAQSHKWDLKIVFFTYCSISLLTLSKFSQCFKVLILNIETAF